MIDLLSDSTDPFELTRKQRIPRPNVSKYSWQPVVEDQDPEDRVFIEPEAEEVKGADVESEVDADDDSYDECSR